MGGFGESISVGEDVLNDPVKRREFFASRGVPDVYVPGEEGWYESGNVALLAEMRANLPMSQRPNPQVSYSSGATPMEIVHWHGLLTKGQYVRARLSRAGINASMWERASPTQRFVRSNTVVSLRP
jgi:hypothetical protein